MVRSRSREIRSGSRLSEQIFVERGYVASHENETPIETNRFHADLFWIVREPLRVGHFYDLRLATQDVKCQIVSIEQVMDSSTLESKSDGREQVGAQRDWQTDNSNPRPTRHRQPRSHPESGPLCYHRRWTDLRWRDNFRRHLHGSNCRKEQKYFLDRRKNYGSRTRNAQPAIGERSFG